MKVLFHLKLIFVGKLSGFPAAAESATALSLKQKIERKKLKLELHQISC